MGNGWIKLHRVIKDNWIWQDEKKLKWWMDILLRANYCDKELLLGNFLLQIKRGSFHCSVVNLARDWKADRKTIMKFLNLLEKEGMIKTVSGRHGTTITVIKYEEYQGGQEENLIGEDSFKDSKKDNGINSSKNNDIKSNVDNTLHSNMDSSTDNSIHNTVDSILHSSMNSNMDSTLHNNMDNGIHSNVDSTMDTTKKVNNINNLKKEKKEKKEKKVARKPQPLSPSLPVSLVFKTEAHKKIFETFGEVTYRTWFMDTDIDLGDETTARFKVKNELMERVIKEKFKEPLTFLMGRKIEIGIFL